MCEACCSGSMNRREFMASASALTAAGFLTPGLATGAERNQPRAAGGKNVRICTMLGQAGQSDRNWNLCEEHFEEIRARLDEIEGKLGNVEFVTGHVNSPDEAANLMEEAGEDAPVLAISSGIGWLIGVMPPVLEANRPAAVYSYPGSGHDWMYPPRWREQEGHPVTLFSSSDYGELERAARLLRAPALMKQSRALLFPNAQGTPASCDPNQVKEKLGADVVEIPYERVEDIIDGLKKDAVEAETDRWINEARDVIEPSRNDVLKASRMCLALDQLIEEEQADAVAVGGCMGWLERGFPCLAFTQLRDRGIPAVCEGDMDSLWTMMLFQYAFNRPGFQGNNYIDTAQNSMWIAHCTGARKMDGPEEEAAGYSLRGHSEVGGDGAVPEIFYRIGQEITRSKFVHLDTFLLSNGVIAEVPEKSTIACRTQARVEVDDAERMARKWGGGVLKPEHGMMTMLHRVLFYGDHTRDVEHLAHLMGVQVIRED
ncbi:MAG: hypothetical protein ACLFV4_05240 [Candidatus Hydrogenedentota bacterium]